MTVEQQLDQIHNAIREVHQRLDQIVGVGNGREPGAASLNGLHGRVYQIERSIGQMRGLAFAGWGAAVALAAAVIKLVV